MKLPDLQARVNAELRERHAAGRSVDIIDVEWTPLVDDDIGVFTRNTFHFADGDILVLDSQEMSDELRIALQQRAMQ